MMNNETAKAYHLNNVWDELKTRQGRSWFCKYIQLTFCIILLEHSILRTPFPPIYSFHLLFFFSVYLYTNSFFILFASWIYLIVFIKEFVCLNYAYRRNSDLLRSLPKGLSRCIFSGTENWKYVWRLDNE